MFEFNFKNKQIRECEKGRGDWRGEGKGEGSPGLSVVGEGKLALSSPAKAIIFSTEEGNFSPPPLIPFSSLQAPIYKSRLK